MKRFVVPLAAIALIGAYFLLRSQSYIGSKTIEEKGSRSGCSVSLDMSDLEPIMQRVSGQIESGLSTADVSKVVAVAKELDVDEEENLDFDIVFKGKAGKLQVQIVMDDIEAPDLALFSDMPELIHTAEELIVSYMKELGR